MLFVVAYILCWFEVIFIALSVAMALTMTDTGPLFTKK